MMDFVCFGVVLKFFLGGLCIYFFVSWVGHLYANLALQDSTPCLVDFLFVLFFFGWFGVRRRRFFFSQCFFFSLSLRRWGNTSPLGVCISPSVLRPHALRLQSVLQGPHLHPGIAPAPVFFCFGKRSCWFRFPLLGLCMHVY